MQAGAIVLSTAGHDAGNAYVVMKCGGEFVFLADGKRRLMDKPKKKRLKHVADTQARTDISKLMCNAHVRKAIKNFKSKGGCYLG